MRTEIVLTLTGKDRVGIVEEVTGILLELGGNLETSRMVHLGGEFAMLMLVSLPTAGTASLDSAIERLTVRGYKVTVTVTEYASADASANRQCYRIEVAGADHEGIVHEIAAGIAEQGISIESMETETSRAPVSGGMLFSMTSRVMVPANLDDTEWIKALVEAADHAGVDVTVTGPETDYSSLKPTSM